MITISGQLAIRTIVGRNGDFNVGRLTTSIGEFVVKDAQLDQYNEGKYDGQFVITEIKPSSYSHRGRFVMEIRAHLAGMTLDDLDNLTQEDTDDLDDRERDPIEEDVIPTEPLLAKPTFNKPRPSYSDDTMPFGIDMQRLPTRKPSDDEVLFGTLWPLGSVVKIDPTVSRQLIRDQCKRLGELGYVLDFRLQQWSLNSESELGGNV
ncbi:Protein of uncharacterised function (DUF3275) [Pseudomonas luteola]|uniref:Protein of uncharacterized function (DUF3275) n=1 Tax=Pseudomonas luteola TaxID=47886 RepID=A0A2X2C3E6_PSELU|nr:DUF3275 family protein [Pseudomonas luteola]SPZ02547.1 Protein of uncharacterised function (DUF3275) [Pseudomonas luteola]